MLCVVIINPPTKSNATIAFLTRLESIGNQYGQVDFIEPTKSMQHYFKLCLDFAQ